MSEKFFETIVDTTPDAEAINRLRTGQRISLRGAIPSGKELTRFTATQVSDNGAIITGYWFSDPVEDEVTEQSFVLRMRCHIVFWGGFNSSRVLVLVREVSEEAYPIGYTCLA